MGWIATRLIDVSSMNLDRLEWMDLNPMSASGRLLSIVLDGSKLPNGRPVEPAGESRLSPKGSILPARCENSFALPGEGNMNLVDFVKIVDPFDFLRLQSRR